MEREAKKVVEAVIAEAATWRQAAVSPRLEVIPCASFAKVWDDHGTGSRGDISIWHVVAPPGYFCLGDYAERHHDAQPREGALVVREAVEGDTPLLAKPVDFVKTWDSRKTGCKYGSVSFWRPLPPTGYVALGDVTTSSSADDQKPSRDSMRCVHKSLVTVGRWEYPQAWWDSGSGGSYGDASLWYPRPADAHGINSSTFKSDWAHCFPVLFQPYVLKDQKKLHQSSKSNLDANSERQGRKATLMSHNGRFLRLQKNGEAFTATWTGVRDETSGEPEEVWTIFQTQQKASFMNRHGLYLSCNATGALEGVPKVNSEQEEFEVMIVNDKISIKSHLGKFLTVPRSADSDSVGAQSDKPYSWTVNFLSVTSGVYATFQSQRGGLFMSANSDGSVVLVARDEPGPQEKWTLHDDERKLTLLSSWGNYLSVAGGTLSARSATVTESERFWRYTQGHTKKLIIRSKSIGRNVTAAADGQRVDVSEKASSERCTWTVQLTFY